MQSVGQRLRDERLRQGLTLNDVSESTRISLKNLQAIEGDDLSQLSSPFFYKSFARQFADYLGVEFSNLSEAVKDSANSMPEPLVPGQEDAPLPKVAALRPSRSKNSRFAFALTSLVAVLVGCSGLYALWKAAKYNNWETSAVHWVSSLWHSSKSEVGTETSSVQAKNTPATANPNQSAPSQRTPPASGFYVEISAIEKTWLSIVSDGRKIYSGILEPNQTTELEGHESASIRTGNAGGLAVVFNGREIGPLGPKGQVRTVVFTKNNYEIVPPAEHIALTTFAKPEVTTAVE